MKQVMYIGPDIKKVVTKNKIFTYYPKDIVDKAKKIDPLADKLFVPMDKIVEKKAELKKRGTLINIAYQRLKMKED